MRGWKIVALCLTVLVLAAALAGNITALFPAKEAPARRIIFVYKTTLREIEFWRSVSDGIATGAKEMGVQTTILGPEHESEIEENIKALQRAVSLRPDAIVLAAADYERLAPYARRAADAGILLLTLDSAVAGDAARCYVGSDNYRMGRRMAEELMARIPPGGKVGVVGHVAASQTAIQRVGGVRDALAEAGTSTLLEPVYCDNSAATAKEMTDALLARHPDITGLIATNEMSAVGLCEAVAAAGLQGGVSVVTCDNSSRQIEYLERGVIDATVVQKPFNMGYFSVVLACRLMDEPGDPEIGAVYDTGFEVITVENYFTLENQELLFPFWE